MYAIDWPESGCLALASLAGLRALCFVLQAENRKLPEELKASPEQAMVGAEIAKSQYGVTTPGACLMLATSQKRQDGCQG